MERKQQPRQLQPEVCMSAMCIDPTHKSFLDVVCSSTLYIWERHDVPAPMFVRLADLEHTCSTCGGLPDGACGDSALASAEATAQRQHAPGSSSRGSVDAARPGRQGRAAGSWAGQGMQTGPGQAKPGLCTGVCRMKSWNWFNCEEGASLQ